MNEIMLIFGSIYFQNLRALKFNSNVEINRTLTHLVKN